MELSGQNGIHLYIGDLLWSFTRCKIYVWEEQKPPAPAKAHLIDEKEKNAVEIPSGESLR